MNKILDLAISYPDFQLNQIIMPDETDTNNAQIVTKVNQIVLAINTLTQGTTGAKEVTIAPLPEFPTATNVQTAIQQIATYCKSNNTTIGDILTRVTNAEKKNTEQDTRLTAIETKNTEQDGRLKTSETDVTNIKAKDVEQDGRLTAIEGVNATQTTDIKALGTRTTATETKNTEQDRRIAELEVKDDLDESWIRGIDERVTTNTTGIANLGEEIEEIRKVNANAELIEARTSEVYGITYDSLQKRLTDTEINIGTDFASDKRTQFNVLVVDENVDETWSDNVRLGDLKVHNADPTAHSMLITDHEMDEASHTDIREEVAGKVNTENYIAFKNTVRTKLYTNPEQFGLSDSELTTVNLNEMMNQIVKAMGADARLHMRLTSATPNMRTIIGMNKASTLTLDTVEAEIYRAELKYNDSPITYFMFGAGLESSGWVEVAMAGNTAQYKKNPSDDANDCSETGFYKIPSHFKNMPPELGASTEGEMKVYKHAGNYFVQYFYPVYAQYGVYIRSCRQGVWDTKWTKSATTTEATLIDSDLRNNWKINHTVTPVKLERIEKTVFATGFFEGGSTAIGLDIAVIPPEFRPARTQYLSTITTNNTTSKVQRLVLWADGVLQVSENPSDVFISFYTHWRLD